MNQKSIAVITAALIAVIITGCKMDVNEVTNTLLVDPYITTQPASISYYPAQYTAPPELEVVVDEWNSDDGSLSYQWYQFDTIVQFLSGAAKIDGATSSKYTPAALKTAAGSYNYFYVEVTNTNSSAKDRQSATVRSEVAVISFNTAGNPAIPILTRQPQDEQARFARPLNALSVRADSAKLNAEAAGGTRAGDLYYQWYSVNLDAGGNFADANSDGIPDATAISGAIFASYVPEATQLGKRYYFALVTHAFGNYTVNADGTLAAGTGQQSIQYTVPATVNILPGLRAAAPIIDVQPKPALYIAGNTSIAPLSVTATSPDAGTLSYQWYSNTVAKVAGGTPISGANGASYALADVSGSAFYYVEVTNTNTNVVGEQTASINSRPVNVRRQTANAPASGNATLQIGSLTDTNNRFNYIRGYGGMEVAWANFPETYPAETELQYNPDELGYNILRIMLPVSNVDIDLAMEDLVVTTQRRPHYYDNVKIVNKYGGYVAGAPWSPPKEWKSNNSINGGGILRYEYYAQYAAYLKSFAQHMYNRGAPIYCISIQNEPNYTAGYDGCEWTGVEMMNFFNQVGVFTEGVRGYGGGKQLPRVLTMNGESANNPDINHQAIDNAKAYAAIDVFARHVYGDRHLNLWTQRPNVQQVDKKEVWMTEHNINGANAAGYVLDSKWNAIWRFMNDIDLVMRLNNENAFVWWASKRFYSMVGDGQYGTSEGVALPRGYGLSHYSKYTIDTTRIGFTLTGTFGPAGSNPNAAIVYGVTAGKENINNNVNGDPLNAKNERIDMDNPTARITAYVSKDGKEISMVMWTPPSDISAGGASDGYDMGTMEIKMPTGFEIASAVGIRSIGDAQGQMHQPYEDQLLIAANRQSAFVTLGPRQIISVKFTKQE